MNLFKCACVAFCAILLCGCLESKGEFEAINAGKISAIYENGVLKILDSRDGNSSLGMQFASEAKQPSKIKSNSCEAPKSRPLRGAKNRIEGCSSATADFLLEAEKRGSPPKSEKRQLLGTQFNSRGERERSVALLRKEISELNKQNSENIADSANETKNAESNLNCHFERSEKSQKNRDSSPTAQNDKAKTDSHFILFFFTTTCGVCKAQIPILQEIAQELENENIKIYGILGNAPNKDLAQKYAKSSAISLSIFYENAARRFFSQIVGGIKGVPVIVIFKDGKVKEKFVGLIPKGKILSAL
ncbi:thioredoxin family protein [Helicobacter sp. 23-1045]